MLKNTFSQHHFLSGGHGSSLMRSKTSGAACPPHSYGRRGFTQAPLSKKGGAGFTLIELLVVIAIVGFLSSILIVNLNSARKKASIAATKESFLAVRAGAVLCLSHNSPLTYGNPPVACPDSGTFSTWPVAGQRICLDVAEIGTWPVLPPTWAYASLGCISDVSRGTFYFSAFIAGQCFITCTHLGCTFTAC